MKAFILAAGLGTRLLPFTRLTPKPLFPIAGRPLLDYIITALEQSGCEEILINTHHLNREIEAFIANRSDAIPVRTIYEADILGTGGAIRNAAAFFDHRPFVVINSDILTDIPVAEVYRFHLQHGQAATMALCDDAEFNSVEVDSNGFVTGFAGAGRRQDPGTAARLTFTGIQVLDPVVLDYIPPGTCCSIIDAYRALLADGRRIKSFPATNYSWQDLGTPQRYRAAVYERLAPAAFQHAFSGREFGSIVKTRLAGDGSDRSWFRLVCDDHSLIMADHGIRTGRETTEADAFVAIGRHLFRQALPVPEIHAHDTFSGLVFVDDLGDQCLQEVVQRLNAPGPVAALYREVVDLLIRMSLEGAAGFKPEWTCQSAAYTPELIVEKECRYFVDAFLNGYCRRQVPYDLLAAEFDRLAHRAVESGINGFMHRDFQSRNIMIQADRIYLIDFQGGRIGPIQYDLASLLIDPYVQLAPALQATLLADCSRQLSARIPLDPEGFMTGYRYCSLTRNLQILGAFGYLSRVKGKRAFETYIPAALDTLKCHPALQDSYEFPRLRSIVENL